MHIAMAVLWLLSVVVPFIVGGFLGLLTGVFKGGELSHAYARHLDRTCSDCESAEAERERTDRLQATATAELMRVGAQIFNDTSGGGPFTGSHHNDLAHALEFCEREMRDWLDSFGDDLLPPSDEDEQLTEDAVAF